MQKKVVCHHKMRHTTLKSSCAGHVKKFEDALLTHNFNLGVKRKIKNALRDVMQLK